MSDAIENKAVEILDKSQAAVGLFADKLGEMAKQYGPDVADAALQMARVDAAQGLVYGTLCGLAAITCAYYGRWFWKTSRAAHNYYQLTSTPVSDRSCEVSGNFSTLSTLSALMGIGFTIAAIALLSDIWRWVGIFEPKLWLAKRILGL